MEIKGKIPKEVPGWARRLASARELAGYDRPEFAKALGIQYETFSRYERGETEPSVDTWVKIRGLTNISLDDLLLGRRKPS